MRSSVGHPPAAHLLLEDRQAEPVDLDHQQARGGVPGGAKFPCGQPADLAAVIGIVVGRAQDLGEDRVQDRQGHGVADRRTKAPDADPGHDPPDAQDDQDLDDQSGDLDREGGQRRKREEERRAGRER